MFEYYEVGKSIKKVARIVAICSFVAWVISALSLFIRGVIFLVDGEDGGFLMMLMSIAVVFIGYWVAWLSGLLLFGFGELVDSNTGIRNNTKPGASQATQSVIRPATSEKRTYPSSAVTKAGSAWECTCGRKHPQYVTSCVCGISRSELLKNSQSPE